MIGLLQLFAVGLVVAWVGVVLYVAWSLGRVPRYTYGSAVARGKPGDPSELDRPAAFESWRTRAWSCAVWEIEGDDPDGPVVVMTHGWSRSGIDALIRFEAVRGVVSKVVAWDLPGHGESGGKCELGAGEWGVLVEIVERLQGADVEAEEARLDALGDTDLDDEGVSSPLPAGERPVVLYGWSMGAGVTLEAAAALAGTERVSGVVAESPYSLVRTPARNVMREMGVPWRTTLGPALFWVGSFRAKGPMWRGFDRREIAAEVDAPVLVVHGDADEICPVEDGRAIAAAAGGEFVVIEGGTHNGLWTDEGTRGRMGEVVCGFLEGMREK